MLRINRLIAKTSKIYNAPKLQNTFKQTIKPISTMNFQPKNKFFTSNKIFDQKQIIFIAKNKFGFPKHDNLQMPLLSPTMEKGTIQKWNFNEGDQLMAGDVLCEVETDKSTVGFEVQEDFILAKKLYPEGTGDISVGTIIGIGVKKQADVAAFKDVTPESLTKPLPVKQESEPEPVVSKGKYPKHDKMTMPLLSPTMEKGTIQGDKVMAGEVICEVETDKSTVGFEIQEDIYLAKILVPEGTGDISVGQVIFIGVSKEKYIDAFKDYKLDAEKNEDLKEKQQPSVTDDEYQKLIDKQKEQEKKEQELQKQAEQKATKAKAQQQQQQTLQQQMKQQTVKLDPEEAEALERRIQRQQKIIYSHSENTEENEKKLDLILEEIKDQSQIVFTDAENPYLDTPTSKIRRTIAGRLHQAKREIPHYHLSINVEMDKLLQFKNQLNIQRDKTTKITINDFIIKSSALALREIPIVNSQWMGEYIRTYKHADICISVMTERGLITPIVYQAEQKNLADISSTVKQLTQKAKQNKLALKDYDGGTFTISNLGPNGIHQFTAVINIPQTCLLAVSQVQTKMIADPNAEKLYRVANIMDLTLSCDNRVVDPQNGAEFLNLLKNYIENPIDIMG